MGIRDRLRQLKSEWDDTPVPDRPKPKPPKPNGICDQRGCTNTAWGHNTTCNNHIAGM